MPPKKTTGKPVGRGRKLRVPSLPKLRAANSRGYVVGPFFPNVIAKGTFFSPRFLSDGVVVTCDWLYQRLEAEFPTSQRRTNALRLPEDFDDKEYYVPTRTEVDLVFDQRSSLGRGYLPEILDCEDFAYWLKADFVVNRYWTHGRNQFSPFAVGMLWGGNSTGNGHCCNIVLTADNVVSLMDATPNGPGIVPTSYWGRSVDYIVI